MRTAGSEGRKHATVLETFAVADIIVRDRVRKGVGNVLGLADSITKVGLLHPLVLNTRHELIAGERRLAAVKKLGWSKVPVRIVETLDDAVAALLAEEQENTCRQNLTLSELVEVGRRIEAIEKERAKQRRKATLNQGKSVSRSGKFPERDKGQTRDKVATALGISGKTYEKIKQVAEAAEEQPEKFGDLPAVMNEKSVDAAHKEMKRRQEAPVEPAGTASARDRRPGVRPTVPPQASSPAAAVIACLEQLPPDEAVRSRVFAEVVEWIGARPGPAFDRTPLPSEAARLLDTGVGCLGMLAGDWQSLGSDVLPSIAVELVPYLTDPRFVYIQVTIGAEQVATQKPVRRDVAGAYITRAGAPPALQSLLVWVPTEPPANGSNPWLELAPDGWWYRWKDSGARVDEPRVPARLLKVVARPSAPEAA